VIVTVATVVLDVVPVYVPEIVAVTMPKFPAFIEPVTLKVPVIGLLATKFPVVAVRVTPETLNKAVVIPVITKVPAVAVPAPAPAKDPVAGVAVELIDRGEGEPMEPMAVVDVAAAPSVDAVIMLPANPEKPDPVITTEVPAAPLEGVTLMVGRTIVNVVVATLPEVSEACTV